MALRDRPIINAMIERLKENRPLVGAIVEGIQAAAARKDTKIEPSDVDAVTEEVLTSMAANPVVQSQTNSEPWFANRVKVGLAITGASALLKAFDIDIGLSDEDMDLWTNIIMGGGLGIAALGEWLSRRLAAIDWKRPWTIIGIGRKAA